MTDTWKKFKSDDYKEKAQALGKKITNSLGIEFVCCQWVDHNLEFKGSFRYKEVDNTIILATRKELQDNMLRKRETSIEAMLLNWKRGLDKD